MLNTRFNLSLIGIFTLVLLSSQVVAQKEKSSNMNLTAYNFGSLGKLTPYSQLDVLQKTGYKGIILNSQTKADSTNLDVFLSELKGNKKFNIHAVMVRYDFTEPINKREGWKTIVDKIADKNIELWVIFGKKTEGFGNDYIEDKLREINAYAKLKSVKVILYPHSKCVIASAEEALPFVQKINNPNLQLAIHLCHEIRAGNGARFNEVFNAVKGFIGAVTVCGTDSVADFSKPQLMDKSTIKPIGEGNFDMQKFIIPLRKSGYKGLVGFINFKIEDEPELYLKNSLREWKSIKKWN